MLIPDPNDPPRPLLKEGKAYWAHDRIVCGRVRCAGMTAIYTKRTIGGARVTAVTSRGIAEWIHAAPELPMACECGAVTLYTPEVKA